eukprot:snap_masked-scaffold_6-processed-gene-1.10-mRNA-1 protein AED:1.00 eAED:1.00 QI:0/0/0/0/1/1/2/0/67
MVMEKKHLMLENWVLLIRRYSGVNYVLNEAHQESNVSLGLLTFQSFNHEIRIYFLETNRNNLTWTLF